MISCKATVCGLPEAAQIERDLRDVTDLLTAAAQNDAGEAPRLLAFVEQIRTAGAKLDLDPCDVEESVSTASITVPERGGAIRTIIGSRRRHAIGVYASTKSGFLQPYEGRIERALIHWCEADGHTVDYQSQPLVMRFSTVRGRGAWIPDLWRQPLSGPVELIEVKRSPRDLLMPGYAAKLACAAAVATSLGYRFRLMYKEEISGNFHRRFNLARVQGRRNVHPTKHALASFEKAAAHGELAHVGDVRRHLAADGEAVRGMALVHGLIARARIAVDLDDFLCDASPVEVLATQRPVSRIRF